jgi:serine/threonine-protein phosphatase 6 catalytic subunit
MQAGYEHGLEILKSDQILPEKDFADLCEAIKEILAEESNLQPVASPVIICGDIHGQFYDVLNLFTTGGEIKSDNNNSYIFIGDFVDRGYNSVETFSYLMLLKVLYPGRITLLRGNHESRQISMTYGFYDEILKKYGNSSPWRLCQEVFDLLPLAAVVDGRILCVHGGLSPAIKTIDQIRTVVQRNQEVPQEGPFCDLMWSDPTDDTATWLKSARGAGHLFGAQVTKEFNLLNGLDLVVRAHQLVNEGYKYHFSEQLMTIWSAPNYCYRCGNDAALFILDDKLERSFKTFKAVNTNKNIPTKNVIPYFL